MNGFGDIPKIKMLTFLPHTHFLRSYLQAERWEKLRDLSALETEDRTLCMEWISLSGPWPQTFQTVKKTQVV